MFRKKFSLIFCSVLLCITYIGGVFLLLNMDNGGDILVNKIFLGLFRFQSPKNWNKKWTENKNYKKIKILLW